MINLELTMSIFFAIAMVEVLKAAINEYFRHKSSAQFGKLLEHMDESLEKVAKEVKEDLDKEISS